MGNSTESEASSFIIDCMYPHTEAFVVVTDDMQVIFKLFYLKNKELHILGDFNDNLLAKENKTTQLVKSNILTQLINKPTKVMPTSSTLLDLVIINKVSIVLTYDVVPHEIAP